MEGSKAPSEARTPEAPERRGELVWEGAHPHQLEVRLLGLCTWKFLKSYMLIIRTFGLLCLGHYCQGKILEERKDTPRIFFGRITVLDTPGIDASERVVHWRQRLVWAMNLKA